MKIFESATKIVLLTIMTVLALLALIAGAHSIVSGNFDEASKIILGIFGSAVSFLMGFYFSDGVSDTNSYQQASNE